MPRGTTLVGLPQPTQSVQSRILLDTAPYDNGRNPAKLSGFRVAFSLAAPGWVRCRL
jgi:hypothetical protein